MSSQLGRRAEDRFKSLCTEADITCNKSTEDDHGWDFLVEYVPKEDTRIPADKRPGPRQVLVQVKCTQTPAPRTRLKVSNALKLTNSGLPCFVVLFHWPRDGEEEKIYAKHVWTETMRHALRRGRELTKTNSSANRTKLTMRFDQSDEHTLDLVDWIVSTVESEEQGYGEVKRRLKDSLGYEQAGYRAEVTLGPLNGFEDIVDHQLKIKPHLPVSQFRLIDARFGIDTPVPQAEMGRGRIVMETNNEIPVRVVLRTSGEEAISLPATARYPNWPGLPRDMFKFVVESWLLRLTISNKGTGTLVISGSWSDKLKLEQLVEISKFYSWGGKRITGKLVRERVPAIAFSAEFSSTGNELQFQELSEVAVTLRKIEREAGSPCMKISLGDLYESWSDSYFIHQILTGRNLCFTANIDPDWKARVSHIRLMSYFDWMVDDSCFFVVFDMTVNDRSPEPDRVTFDCGERKLVDSFVGTDAQSVRSAGLASFNNHKAKNGPDHILIEDFRSFAKP